MWFTYGADWLRSGPGLMQRLLLFGIQWFFSRPENVIAADLFTGSDPALSDPVSETADAVYQGLSGFWAS